MVTAPTSHVRSVTSSSGTSGISTLYGATPRVPARSLRIRIALANMVAEPWATNAAGRAGLVAIEGGDQQSRSDGEDGDAGGDFPGVFLCVRRGLLAAALQIIASGGEVLLHGHVLNRRLDL